MATTTCTCRKCGSTDIVRNGSNGSGNPKYKCNCCGSGGVFASKRKPEGEKDKLVAAARERCSARGLGRISGVPHQTAPNWIKKAGPPGELAGAGRP
jgi:transposase-like protein